MSRGSNGPCLDYMLLGGSIKLLLDSVPIRSISLGDYEDWDSLLTGLYSYSRLPLQWDTITVVGISQKTQITQMASFRGRDIAIP